MNVVLCGKRRCSDWYLPCRLMMIQTKGGGDGLDDVHVVFFVRPSIQLAPRRRRLVSLGPAARRFLEAHSFQI